MCSMTPIITRDMNLFRTNPPPHIVHHRVKTGNGQSTRPLPVRAAAGQPSRKLRLPASPPRGSHFPTAGAAPFRHARDDVLQTIFEEDETYATGVCNPDELCTKENQPTPVPVTIEEPVHANYYQGTVPVSGHQTIWDRMVHRISSVLHNTGTMRYDLRRNSGEYLIKNVPGQHQGQGKERGKTRDKPSKHAHMQAHKMLEAEVYPIPTHDMQRFHFHGRG